MLRTIEDEHPAAAFEGLEACLFADLAHLVYPYGDASAPLVSNVTFEAQDPDVRVQATGDAAALSACAAGNVGAYAIQRRGEVECQCHLADAGWARDQICMGCSAKLESAFQGRHGPLVADGFPHAWNYTRRGAGRREALGRAWRTCHRPTLPVSSSPRTRVQSSRPWAPRNDDGG